MFDGDLKNWFNFKGQFREFDQDPNIDKQDKFTYPRPCSKVSLWKD